MKSKKSLVAVDFFLQLLDLYEFEIYIDKDEEDNKVFRLRDLQGANLGNIENEKFKDIASILTRMDAYHNDYIYRSLDEDDLNEEIIERNSWDFIAKRYLESDEVAEILSKCIPEEYENITEYYKNFDSKEILKILDKEDLFYKNICNKYFNTMAKELMIETENEILHIFVEDEYSDLKYDGKININNYKNYLDANFNVYNYKTYKELYEDVVKNEVDSDMYSLGLFNDDNKWDFYLSFEEIKKLGYAHNVKAYFIYLDMYGLPEYDDDFFEQFSLEELNYFEDLLYLFYSTDVIKMTKYEGILTINNNEINYNILKLVEGLMKYKDFVKETKISKSQMIEVAVSRYFAEKGIKDLMEYGCDADEGLYKISTLYEELFDRLNINHSGIYTDDISDGKYVTIVESTNNDEIVIYTNAWNGSEIVADNVRYVNEEFERLVIKEQSNDLECEV